jgi:hypothetical protein
VTVLSPLIRNDFSLCPTWRDNVLLVEFKGSADNEAQSLLADFFRLVHIEAKRAKVSEVVVDVHALEFINSSCFKTFITWVAENGSVESDARYRIRFLKDPNVRWQARSLDALHRMCLASVNVEDWVGGTK